MLKGYEDADSAARTEVDVFNIRPVDLKIVATSAILTSWQQTWHTLCTKLRVVKESIGRWQHAGERNRREQVCLHRTT